MLVRHLLAIKSGANKYWVVCVWIFGIYKNVNFKVNISANIFGLKFKNYFCTKLLATNDLTFVPTFVGNCFFQQMLGQHYEHVRISNATNVASKVGKSCLTNLGSCRKRPNNIANICWVKCWPKTWNQQMLVRKMLAFSVNDPTSKQLI